MTYKFIPIVFAAGLLAACDPMAAPPPAAPPAPPPTASEALAIQAAATEAQDLNITAGRDFGAGFVLQGARAEDNKVIVDFGAPIASTASANDLATMRETVRGALPQAFCSDPKTAQILALGVSYEFVVNSTDGQAIDTVPVGFCA